MTKNKEKRAFSAYNHHNTHQSQLLCSGCQAKNSPNSAKKMNKKEKRCVSVKDPSRVVSFQTSKASSVRKPKHKPKSKPILMISEHQTPVLGKYFIASNSIQPLPQAPQLDSISDPTFPEEKPSQDESKLTRALAEEDDSAVKAPLSIKSRINRVHLAKIHAPNEIQEELDCTIDKLKSKQQTIEILNKTIQTRLVDAAPIGVDPRVNFTREDAYEVEMNFYVDKITILQKQLYEKSRLLKTAQSKNEEFATLARNTKKLIKENSRMREQLELSSREIAALKKLLAKAEAKMM